MGTSKWIDNLLGGVERERAVRDEYEVRIHASCGEHIYFVRKNTIARPLKAVSEYRRINHEARSYRYLLRFYETGINYLSAISKKSNFSTWNLYLRYLDVTMCDIAVGFIF